jgi:hypothetical protein
MRPERSEQDARTYPSDGWATPGPIEHELDFVGALHPVETPQSFSNRITPPGPPGWTIAAEFTTDLLY